MILDTGVISGHLVGQQLWGNHISCDSTFRRQHAVQQNMHRVCLVWMSFFFAAPFSFDMESDDLDKGMVKELVLEEVMHYRAKQARRVTSLEMSR